MRNFFYGFLSALVMCVIGYASVNWHRLTDHSALVATTAAPLSDKPKVTIPVTGIRAYGDKVKKALHLPTAVASNPDQHVTAASTVKPNNHAVTVTSVVDAKTGDTTPYIYVEPLPWLAFNQKRELSLYYGGESGHSGAVWRTQARLDFMQVKALNFSAMATLDSDGVFYRGVGVRLEW